MNGESSVKALAIIRVAIGVIAWVTPNFGAKLFGLDPKGNPQAPYLGRLFGVRDVVLGIGTLRAEGPSRRPWLVAGLVCDSADTAAAKLGHRDGYLSTPTALMVAAPAVAAVALGAAGLREQPAPLP